MTIEALYNGVFQLTLTETFTMGLTLEDSPFLASINNLFDMGGAPAIAVVGEFLGAYEDPQGVFIERFTATGSKKIAYNEAGFFDFFPIQGTLFDGATRFGFCGPEDNTTVPGSLKFGLLDQTIDPNGEVLGAPAWTHVFTIDDDWHVSQAVFLYNGQVSTLIFNQTTKVLAVASADGTTTTMDRSAIPDEYPLKFPFPYGSLVGGGVVFVTGDNVRFMYNSSANVIHIAEVGPSGSTYEEITLGGLDDPADFLNSTITRAGDFGWLFSTGPGIGPVFDGMDNRIMLLSQDLSQWWDVQLVAGDAHATLAIGWGAQVCFSETEQRWYMRTMGVDNNFDEDSNSNGINPAGDAVFSVEAPTPGSFPPCAVVVQLPDSCNPSPDYLDVLWPFTPNWGDNVKQKREFKTDILTSRGGQEQRIAMRAEARRTLTMTNHLRNAQDVRDYERLLALNQQGRWLVPDWTRNIRVSTNVAAGVSAITFDEVPDWFDTTAPVALHYGRQLALGSLALIEDSNSGVTFTLTSDYDWPAGTKLYPALYCFMRDAVESEGHTNRVRSLEIDFDVDPGSFDEELTGLQETIFNDREIWPFAHNWAESIKYTDQRPVDTMDEGQGRYFRYAAIDHRTTVRQVTIVGKTAAEARRIDHFFMRHYGQQREFYVESGQDDIVLSQGFSNGDNILHVDDGAFAEAFAGDQTRRALVVVKTDDTRIYRSINQISTDSNSNSSVISLATGMTEDVALDEIKRICWLEVCRFATDEMTLEWFTDSVAQTQTNLLAIENLTPDTDGADSNSNSASTS